MNLLLDTHAFIWWLTDQSRLSARSLQALMNNDNTVTLSVASIWEMTIKLKIGKLSVVGDLKDIVQQQVQVNRIQLLAISSVHALKTLDLPLHHRDPFDRMLIAQALSEEMTLITTDASMTAYGVNVLW